VANPSSINGNLCASFQLKPIKAKIVAYVPLAVQFFSFRTAFYFPQPAISVKRPGTLSLNAVIPSLPPTSYSAVLRVQESVHSRQYCLRGSEGIAGDKTWQNPLYFLTE